MRPKKLKSKLLLGVITLVLCSGLLISILVTYRYSQSLSAALDAQARYLSDAIALQSVDLVLTNDLVALQKMLQHQLGSNPALTYLFILKDGRILAHTFKAGVPVDLLTANKPSADLQTNTQKITSTSGDRILDIAIPVFDGKAGTLRLGFSEEPYRRQVNELRLQMTLLTIAVLLLASGGGLLFVKQITGPLTQLSRAVDQVDKGELEVRVQIRGQDEVATLANSFNKMVSRLHTYTRQLEEQTAELEHAHNQTRTVCGMVREIGALSNLREIGTFLIDKFRSLVHCQDMVLLVLNDTRDAVFLLTHDNFRLVRDAAVVDNLLQELEGSDNTRPKFFKGPAMEELLCPTESVKPQQVAFISLVQQGQSFGGLVMTCSSQHSYQPEELDMLAMMLNQAAGVIRRATLHEQEIQDLQSRLESSSEFCGIIGRDPKMQVVYRLIEDIAPTDASILIQGESGTGKELVARAIHQLSPRKDKPFIVINCSAYPAALLESELFGHEKGAFTGAIRQKPGRFELADGGTVFLDEIGEIPPAAQIKLLRVLQTQKFERVGGEKTLAVDVRVLAATNKNLLEEVKKGEFREDLYYRLSVIPVFCHRFAKGVMISPAWCVIFCINSLPLMANPLNL
jgi:transcriptional regulator with PAS, ATPase and Fis domain